MSLRRLASLLWRSLAFAVLAGAAACAPAQELTVSAAASLGAAMREIGAAFVAARPGARVHLNLAGSTALLAQIAQGAPVDVFATADLETMDRAAERRLVAPASRRDLARNELVLVLPRESTLAAMRLTDVAAPAVRRIAIGSPTSVPAGRYARAALTDAGVWEAIQPRLVFAEDVRQVLGYVERGEVDAGFVYRSDAQASGGKVRVAAGVPTAGPVRYPIAVVAASRQPAAAASFVAFATGTAGQAILARHGFAPP